MTQTVRAVIGICAFNEENNIGRLLQNLVSEQNLGEDCRILVVCSGCTDRTALIVKTYQDKDARIELVTEDTRMGKADALNKILMRIRDNAEFLVLANADALPEKGSIDKLVRRLSDVEVGAAFARPMPLKNSPSVCGRISSLIWHLHHIISMSGAPKLSGELCAIRVAHMKEIPEDAVTDEPYIEKAILKLKKKIAYVPDVHVYVRCPKSCADLVRQRKRIWIGHIQLREATRYKVSTSSLKNILLAASSLSPSEMPPLLVGALLEAISYHQAWVAFKRGVVPFAWEPIKSTKDP
jgi:cellulose synthase/poly-beta-1,6-N-acetylglucosamine synthase-like glycosyltransferase